MRTVRLCLATTLVALVIVSSARADAPWSPSAAVPAAPGLPAPERLLHVGFAPGGAGLIAFARALYEPRAFGASVSASGAVAPTGELTGDMHVEDIAFYGRDRMVAAGAGAAGGGVRIAYGVVGGSLGPPRTLLRRAVEIALDGNKAGDAAVLASAFSSERRARSAPRRDTPVLFVRRRGGGFGRPIKLDRAGRVSTCCSTGAVSVNRRGDVLAVWTRNGRAVARIRTASGRLGRRRELGLLQPYSEEEQIAALSVALGNRRDAVVAFARQAYDFYDSQPLGPLTVRVASAGAGGTFGRTRLLERSSVGGAADVGTALAPDGRATVAWTGRERGRLVVRAAVLVDGRPRRRQTVSPATTHSVLTELAAGPRGELVLGWRSFDRSHLGEPVGSSRPRLFVSLRPAGASVFTAPEAVTEPSLAVGAARLAVNPVTRQVMAVWGGPGSGRLQYATRPPVEP